MVYTKYKGKIAVDAETLIALLRAIGATRKNEIDCDMCYGSLDRFVECILVGRTLPTILRCIYTHLQQCPDRREEFDALLQIVARMSH